jgi:hypothetical protein
MTKFLRRWIEVLVLTARSQGVEDAAIRNELERAATILAPPSEPEVLVYYRNGEPAGTIKLHPPDNRIILEDGTELRHYSVRAFQCRYVKGDYCTYPKCECEWN